METKAALEAEGRTVPRRSRKRRVLKRAGASAVEAGHSPEGIAGRIAESKMREAELLMDLPVTPVVTNGDAPILAFAHAQASIGASEPLDRSADFAALAARDAAMKRFGRRGADRWRRSELAGHSEVSVASNSRCERAAVVFIVYAAGLLGRLVWLLSPPGFKVQCAALMVGQRRLGELNR